MLAPREIGSERRAEKPASAPFSRRKSAGELARAALGLLFLLAIAFAAVLAKWAVSAVPHQ
jgi:hypothetical protein